MPDSDEFKAGIKHAIEVCRAIATAADNNMKKHPNETVMHMICKHTSSSIAELLQKRMSQP